MKERGTTKQPPEELFAQGLEDAHRGESVAQFLAQHPDQSAELGPLLRLANQVREAMAAEPRPQAVAATRYRVLTYAGTRWSAPWAWLFPLFGLPRVAAAMAVSLLLVVLTSTSALVASASALPGDPLYPVKTGWENLRLALVFNEEARVMTYAQLAARRTEELAELVSRDRPVSSEVVAVLAHQTNLAVAGLTKEDASEAVGQRLLELTQRQQQVLTDVADKAPESAKPALRQALEVSKRGHERAQEAIEKAREREETPTKQRGAATAEPEERQRGRTLVPDSTPTALPTNAPRREERTPRGKEGSQESAPSTITIEGRKTKVAVEEEKDGRELKIEIEEEKNGRKTTVEDEHEKEGTDQKGKTPKPPKVDPTVTITISPST